MATMKRIRTKIELNLPEYGEETKATIISKQIMFASILNDQDGENPCTSWDGFGTIRSLSRRHINSIDCDEAVSILEADVDAVALSYYEHGNSLWMVAGETKYTGVEFQWDGTRFAGIWIPDDCVRESYMEQDGLSRRDWMLKQAESACETYTQWANGEVYGYSVKVYALRAEDDNTFEEEDDYRYDTASYDDSCFGFYGLDSVREELTGSVKSALSGMGFSKRSIAAAVKAGI